MKKYLFYSLVLAVLAMAFIPKEKYTLSGKVIDDKGNPIIGALVVIKGTKIGTAVDTAGNFRLSNISGKEKLVISAVGFQTKEISVRGQQSLAINLASASQELSEVVVTAYGDQRQTEYVGSTTTINSEKISYAPLYNGLQGKVSGIQIRGARSMSAGYSTNYFTAPQNRYNAAVGFRSGNHKNKKLDSIRLEDVDMNREGYDEIIENPFFKAKENPLSTFSIDVDAASYSNVRRFIKDGQMPPAGAVRIEEMINYFTYQYPQPTNEDPFSVNMEVSSCPWNNKHQLVLIGLQGKKIATENLPPSNLVFLIDVSGSMDEPNKLPLVQASMKLLADQLRPQDKVAMVVYAGSAGVVLPSTSGDKKITIKSAIDKLQAGGSTAGGEGIKLAYKIAKENFIKSGNNRVILCTDGDFNVGVSSDDGLVRLVEDERKSGVFLTVLGYGMGNYQDAKMQKLADKGNGNHAYIDNLKEANKVLVKEAGGTLYTIAKDVKLQIEFNPTKVQGYRLIGYENRILAKEDFNDDTKDAGEMGSGHTVTALYEIIPMGVKADELKSVDELRYQQPNESFSENSFGDELMFVKLRYKKPDGDESKLSEYPLEDKIISISKTSDNFRFAAAVAQFGMLLRNSKFKSAASFEMVTELANNALGKDPEGYRKEFVDLVEKAAALKEGLGKR
jgi:Ca-activated chloride channel homolog